MRQDELSGLCRWWSRKASICKLRKYITHLVMQNSHTVSMNSNASASHLFIEFECRSHKCFYGFQEAKEMPVYPALKTGPRKTSNFDAHVRIRSAARTKSQRNGYQYRDCRCVWARRWLRSSSREHQPRGPRVRARCAH